MNIAVCVKQVPDTDGPIIINTRTKSIEDRHLNYIVNSVDKVAVEQAVLLKEKLGSGQVTVFSMGNNSAETVLRKCLAQGADQAVLVSDPVFNDSDSYRTGAILARAIKRMKFDLVLCGVQASDTNGGLVGAVIAEELGLPLVCSVTKIENPEEPGKLILQKKLDRGDRGLVEVELPALLTIEMGAKPRYATVRSHLTARSKNIDCLDASILGLLPEDIGRERSKTVVLSISPPKPRAKLFAPPSNLSSVQRTMLLMSGGIQEKKSNILEGAPGLVAAKLIDFLTSGKYL